MLDELDRNIIQKLLNNSRISMRQLASELDVALGTIANRLRRLENENIIKEYTVTLDPAKVGWEMTVIVGLRITKGRMIEVQKRIAQDHRVFIVYDVTGDYDSFVIAKVTDTDDLNDLTKGVLTSDGIERSLTHVVLNTVKETAFNLPFTDKS
ncbi:MAG: AsnC family transcriptional regulator [Methanobacteriota archaeon]|nr:MAG: AsnC family transcriptional regulator [Euryarchaeota archaeon]|tara:strand:+ start:3590 stop:4048 length:459 start_codon:yes stop_codon:yes gene_type:complete